jgi:uncharacterized membrane protein
MVLNTKTRLSLVTADPEALPIHREEKRTSPGDLLRKTWHILRSMRGQQSLAWIIALVLITVDIALVGQHALVRYQSYHATAFDLGNFDQAIWNTLHGHPLRFTNRGYDWYGPPTRLGVHVEPILLLIAPLYLLHNGPETLLLLQTLALALGGIPLLLLGLRRLPELPLVAAAFVGAYLATPEILGEALYDFHAVALATPLLLLALWALDARRYRWFVVAAVLAAFCKEEVALSLVPLGVFIAFWRGRPRLGAAVSLLSLAWVALCFLVILPHFTDPTAAGNNFWSRYAWLGSSPGTALHNVLTQPSLLLSPLRDSTRRDYLAVLLRTGGGLGLFAPALWLAALPDIVINVLSTHQEQYSGFYQYNAVILPYLMAAAIFGTAAFYQARRRVESYVSTAVFPEGDACHTTRPMSVRHAYRSVSALWEAVLGHLPIRSQWIAPLVIVWLIASAYWNIAAASADVRPFWMVGSRPNPQQAQIDALLANVPPTASVAATDTLNPHLSDRFLLYLLPDPQSYMADYVAIDLPNAEPANQPADQEVYGVMLTSGSYTIIGIAGNVVLLERSNLLPPALRAPTPATEQIQEEGQMVISYRAARRLGLLEHVPLKHVQGNNVPMAYGTESRQRRVMDDQNAS